MNKVFILSPINSKEAAEILRLYHKEEFYIYFENIEFVPSSLLKEVKCYSIYDQKIDLEEYNKKILQSVVDFGQLKINNQTLTTSLSFNGISYWYYLKFSLYHRSKKKLIQIFLIKQILKTSLSDKGFFKIYTSTKNMTLYFEKEIEIIYSEKEKTTKIDFQFLVKYISLFFFRTIWGTLIFPFRKNNKANTLISTNTYNRQDIIDPISREIIKGDPHLHYLLSKTLKNKKFQYLSQLRPPGKEDNHRLSISDYLVRTPFSRKTIYFEPFLFFSLLSPSLYKKNKALKFIWTKLIQSIQKKTSLSNEEQVIFDTFRSLRKQILLASWREHAAKKLANNLKLATAVAIDEHSLQNKSIFNGFRQKNIKIIAIQHGAISQSNVSYRFSEKDLASNPFPDLTLIRGEYTKQMLMDQNYPKDKLKIVGHIRTDIIPPLANSTNKFDLFENKDKPLILYATQPIPKTEQVLKEQLIKDFFNLCNEFPNYNFVLKPHPNEASLNDYLKYSKNNKYPNFKFYQGELYHLLASVDAVITYFSTVGIEAIYFKKPLLTVDYYQIDAQGYLKDGVSINSLNYTELKENLKELIETGSKVSPLALAEFIEKRVYKIDGKVADRCLESI